MRPWLLLALPLLVGLPPGVGETFSRRGPAARAVTQVDANGRGNDGQGLPSVRLPICVHLRPFAAKCPPEPRTPNPFRNPIDGAELAWVPAGAFRMGSEPAGIEAAWKRFRWAEEKKRQALPELPPHRVELSGFWMYRREVTV